MLCKFLKGEMLYGKFSRCGFEFQERRGPLRGADVVRAVQAAPAYMNRGLRSLYSLTPGCNPSPLWGSKAPVRNLVMMVFVVIRTLIYCAPQAMTPL